MANNTSTKSSGSVASDSSSVKVTEDFQNIQEEMNIMLKHAIHNGLQLPTNLTSNPTHDTSVMISNYNSLVSTIAPATVASITYINSQIFKGDVNRKWYYVPIVTRCLLTAGLSLLTLIGISLLPSVNENNMSQGLLSSSGTTLLANLIFVISAALLGVMFFLLKSLIKNIKNYTLRPIDSIEMNSIIIIGVISGFIISELFTFSGLVLGGKIEVHKMTLALLGGFSSDAIFSILQGVVNKIKLFLSPVP